MMMKIIGIIKCFITIITFKNIKLQIISTFWSFVFFFYSLFNIFNSDSLLNLFSRIKENFRALKKKTGCILNLCGSRAEQTELKM